MGFAPDGCQPLLHTMATAESVAAHIDDDPEQPGGEAGLRAVVVAVRENAEEHVLRQVLRILALPQHAKQLGVNGLAVLVDQSPKR